MSGKMRGINFNGTNLEIKIALGDGNCMYNASAKHPFFSESDQYTAKITPSILRHTTFAKIEQLLLEKEDDCNDILKLYRS